MGDRNRTSLIASPSEERCCSQNFIWSYAKAFWLDVKMMYLHDRCSCNRSSCIASVWNCSRGKWWKILFELGKAWFCADPSTINLNQMGHFDHKQEVTGKNITKLCSSMISFLRGMGRHARERNERLQFIDISKDSIVVTLLVYEMMNVVVIVKQNAAEIKAKLRASHTKHITVIRLDISTRTASHLRYPSYMWKLFWSLRLIYCRSQTNLDSSQRRSNYFFRHQYEKDFSQARDPKNFQLPVTTADCQQN